MVSNEGTLPRSQTPPSSEKNPTRERGGSHPRRRRSFHCRQKLLPSSQLLRWSSPVVNGCRRSGCGCRSHTGASGRLCHFRPRCRRRKTPLPPSRSNAVIVIGICRRCRLRWLPGCHRAGSETAAVSVQPFLLRFELLRLLRKWLGTEVLAAGILIADLGLRRKGFCDAFRLWICVLRIWAQKSRRVYLVIDMFCIEVDYLLYLRLYLDIFCERDRDCIG
ncbi:uncharacterized protein LOC110269492 [Arachis ipaensis]|uniref:uncharacterized protein LOC110269492 n=1 Tax=Arachis ipaensis TaxID=130454 RepID=UPI000A2B3AD1|nr:uncharacterized protein LOC110269492 [Arachis ipaensis]